MELGGLAGWQYPVLKRQIGLAQKVFRPRPPCETSPLALRLKEIQLTKTKRHDDLSFNQIGAIYIGSSFRATAKMIGKQHLERWAAVKHITGSNLTFGRLLMMQDLVDCMLAEEPLNKIEKLKGSAQ